jgi:hypothetical protein
VPILNYTTTLTVDRTAAKIQAMLVKAGARGIAHAYDTTGLLVGMSFVIQAPYGEQAYSLPANVDRVRAVLQRQRVPPRYSTAEHAARVAWKNLHDWTAAQLALVQTETVGLDQVMLPYAHTDAQGTTVYDRFVEQRTATAAIEASGRCG